MELAAGTAVDRFVVEGLIGRGGMASVYRIRHRTLNVAYALKIMHVTHPELADRIRSEGALQAELRHPNIVTVFDMIEVGGLPALVMEYVDGPSMAAMLEVHQPTLDQVDELARGMLKGVRAAHAAGLIHRDLKPANVLLAHADDGYLPKITDFGLAKSLDGSSTAVQTRTGVVMGTPAYMAPEQFRNTRAVDARADIYALGVVLYELCAGRRPYDEEDLFDLLDRVRNADYPRITELVPAIPDRMADAIEGAMAVDPEQRVATVGELYEVWCGNARMDRSRVWNRAVLQQIGQSLSESQASDLDPIPASGARREPGAAEREASPPIEPEPASDAPPPPLATIAGTDGPPALDAGLGAPPTPEPDADADEPVADATMFEPIRRPLPPLEPAAGGGGDAASEPDPAAEDRPRTEWVPEVDDDPPQPGPPTTPSSPSATPAPPVPPAALAQASIFVRSAPPGADPDEPPPARPKVSLTDSTPSLHLPPPAPEPPPAVEGRSGRWAGALTGVAALLMIAVLAVGGGFLLVVGGSLLYAITTGEDGGPLPPIEVRDGGPADAEPPADGEDPAPPDAPDEPGSDDGDAAEPGEGAPDTPEGTPEESPEEAPDGPDEGTDPDATAPAPTPHPAPARPRPRPARGTVVLTGDATSIRLIGGGRSYGAGSVPVGDYELRATFPGQGELAQRATVRVRKGQKVTVHCVSGFFSCSVK